MKCDLNINIVYVHTYIYVYSNHSFVQYFVCLGAEDGVKSEVSSSGASISTPPIHLTPDATIMPPADNSHPKLSHQNSMDGR